MGKEMGFPKGKLDKVVQTRCTAQEHEAFSKKAKSEGLSVSQATRALVNKYIADQLSLDSPSERIAQLEEKVRLLEDAQRRTNEVISQKLGELVA